jgi:hypothetical protein
MDMEGGSHGLFQGVMAYFKVLCYPGLPLEFQLGTNLEHYRYINLFSDGGGRYSQNI